MEKLKKEIKNIGVNPQGLMQAGIEALARNDFKNARIKFRLAILYNPRVASKIALCYENILDEEIGNINARLALADLHLFLGEVGGAVSELEEILDIAPNRADVYNILGKLYLKQSDFDGVIALLEVAFKYGIKDTSLVEMLAGAYMEKGRINEAISLYKGLLTADPNNRNHLRILGELQARVELINDAAASFYSMLNLDASSVAEVIYKLEDLRTKQPDNIYVKEILSGAYVKAIKPSQAAAELEGIIALDASRLDGIIDKYKEILDKYPDEPNTLKALAKAFTMKSAFSEAVSEYGKLMRYSDEYVNDAIAGFKDILARFPGQVHARESLGDAYLKQGHVEEALLEYSEVLKLSTSAIKSIIDKCQKVAKDSPNMILVHQVLGQSYVLSGNGNSAIEEAEFMIYLDKNYAPAHQIMGDAYMRLGNPPKAQSAYATAMGIDPNDISLHRKYADASIAILRTDIESLKKRIEEDPWRLGNHLDLAKLYLLEGDFDKGVKELQMAVKDTSRAPFAYNLLGLAFVELGRFDLAATQFERALEVMPKELSDVSKTVRFNLGLSLEATGAVAQAIAQYEMILSEDVEFGGLQNRIKNLAGMNQESQRNKMIAAVLEQFGHHGLIGMWGPDLRHSEPAGDVLSMTFGQEHNNAGFDHFIKGRYKGSMEEFSLAVALDPKFCAALNNLAVAYMREGHLEQAETRLNLAISLDPGSAVVHNNMGVYHFLKGDMESALTAFNKALESDANLSAAYINLGDIMYSRGSAESAISLWGKIKGNDPLSSIAQRRLAYKTIKS